MACHAKKPSEQRKSHSGASLQTFEEHGVFVVQTAWRRGSGPANEAGGMPGMANERIDLPAEVWARVRALQCELLSLLKCVQVPHGALTVCV